MGDNAIDTGYMRLRGVRIPRDLLLSKRQEVLPDGTYVKKSSGAGKNKVVAQRMSYLTMMGARAGMAGGAASALQRSVTTAVRYSCVRKQGFVDTKSGEGYLAAENAVIDYQMQSFRLFKWLSTAYAFTFTGKAVTDQMSEVSMKLMAGDADAGDTLPEMHATSAGMKALCCTVAGDGMEDCRKMLGGHGYLMNSGVAADLNDYLWKITAEGDPIVMYLQSARSVTHSPPPPPTPTPPSPQSLPSLLPPPLPSPATTTITTVTIMSQSILHHHDHPSCHRRRRYAVSCSNLARRRCREI